MAQRVAALYAEIDAKTDKFEKGLGGAEEAMKEAGRAADEVAARAGELGGIFDATGAAADEAARLQNKLAAAMFDVNDAATRLYEAQQALNENTDPTKQDELAAAVAHARVEFDSANVKAAGLQDQLAGLGKEAGETAKQGNKLGEAFKELTGMDLSKAISVGSIIAVGKALADATQAAANWGDEMGDLAQLTGATVEETSKMAAAFELVGVSTGTLQSAIKGLTNAGLQPNFATIKKLASEYQAIQDPVERNEFLFKKFGRAGLEMAEIMGKSAAELDRLSGAALRSGKVIGEDAAGAAEEFNINMAILKQRVEGAQIAIGNALLPTLNAAAQSFDTLVSIGQMWAVDIQRAQGLITEEQAQLEKLRIAGIEPNTEATEGLTTATEDLARSTSSLSAESDRWAGMAEVAAQAAERKASIDRIATIDAQNYAQAQRDAVQALADLQAKQDGWASSTGQDVINALKEAGIKGREYEAALIATDSILGTSFANDAEKQKKLEELTKAYAEGKISVDEYKSGLNLLYANDMPKTQAAFAEARDRAGELDDKLTRLEGRRVQMFVETVYTELRAAAGGIHDTATGDLKQTTPLGGGRAAGGSFIVPAGYGMDSYPLANVQSGERVTVEPSGQVQTYGGDALLQIVQTLPAAIQRAVRDGMQMAMA